jgi:D-alanyl-D-alanine carboxypeptidase
MNSLNNKLQAIIDSYVSRGIIGASAAVERPGEAPRLICAGTANRGNNEPMRPDHLFRIGSCTKTFVAACIHLLAEEKRLDLDEPVTRWFPDLPRAEELPVRILLNHRSGLPEFENHMPMISSKRWLPQEIVDLAFASTPQRDPWGEMQYNNTGYILAGMIVSAEHSGAPLSAAIRQRLLEPHGLLDTWAGTDELYPEERVARGYMHVEEQAGQWSIDGAGDPIDGTWDATDWFPLSGAGAAGDMVSTAADLARWMSRLRHGEVLGEPAFHEMSMNLNPASFPGSSITQNGHGLLVSTIDGLELKGHIGQIPGHATTMAYHEESGISVALIQNSAAGDFESFYLAGIHAPFGALFRAAMSA